MLTAIGALLLLLQAATIEKQAFRAYQQRDWAAAARLYNSLHASGQGTASTYDNLGVALINLGRWDHAEMALQRAIELDPRHRWAFNHLGFVYRESGRWPEAVEMFRRQIEISPRDPYAYRNLAATLALLGRLEEAEQTAAEHEQRTYERGAVYIDIACSLNTQKQPEKAQRYLEKAAAAGADRSLLAQERAHHALVQGDNRGAERHYLAMLRYRPHDPLVALRLGALYSQMGETAKAADAFGRAISVDDADRVTIRLSASASRTVTLAELRADPGVGAGLLGDLPVDLYQAALLVRRHVTRREKP